MPILSQTPENHYNSFYLMTISDNHSTGTALVTNRETKGNQVLENMSNVHRVSALKP